jgi:uncharacterized protein with GYD domain
MARYIALGKLTREGAMTIKEGAQRFARRRIDLDSDSHRERLVAETAH